MKSFYLAWADAGTRNNILLKICTRTMLSKEITRQHNFKKHLEFKLF